MERHKKLIAQQISNFSALLIVFILGFIRPATAQVDFPIGYVSRGGTYAFISLIEQHKLLEQEGIRPIARFMRLNDREALEETWRMNANVLKDNPSPPVAGIRVVRDFLAQTDPEVKKMNLESFVTTQFTDRLQREGVK